MGILKNLLVTGSARFVNTIKGTAEKAEELSTARSIQTNLASTTATFFDGSENITPGVTGTLGAAHGGTGETSLQNAGNAMLNALGTGSSTPVDADYYISQYVGGGTTTTTYHRRPMSALWAYIKTKVEALGYTKNTGTVTKVSTGAGLTGGDVTTTGTIKANLVSETKLTNAAAAATQTSGRVYPVALDKNGDLAVNVPWTDNNTTYSSKTAASGGTDVSLVTTGQKYTWNQKTSNTGTVTSVATGAGLTGGTITGSGTLKANLASETKSSLASTAMGSTASRQYAVGLDKDGHLSVNIPWTDNNTTYTAATAAPGNIASSGSQGSSTNYARQDHTHGIALATGDSNGQVKIAGQNVSVKGLGSAAYTASTDYATVGHNHDSTYVNVSGDTMTGNLIIKKQTSATVTYEDDTNPRITFQNVNASQNASLIFSDYDSYQTPSSVTLAGSQGGEYFIAPNIKATTKFYGDLSGTASNASKVNNHTVNSDVPANAVFTDTTYTAASATPKAIGTAAVGTSTKYAREDHVHAISLATGDSNGQVKIAGTNVSVKGWNTAATYAVETTVANDAKLPTGAAVKSFVEGKGYVTTDTNNRRSFFGTCSTAAATAAKVVTLEDNSGWELIAGVIVGVKFTITNTASNVKLNVNGSGAKPIYWDHAVYTGNNNGVTGYANRVIYYMYDGTNWAFINHSQNFANNSDTYDRTYLSNNGYKAKSAIVSQNIIVAGTDGLYFHLKTGNAFDITYPILFANSACAANATNNSAYTIIPFTVTTTQSITLTAYKAVYIKGHLVGTTFTPVSTTPLTQTVPTSADGYQYILLGRALNSTTVMYLLPEHPIYEYTDGCFHLVGDRQVKDIVVQVSLSGWSSSTTTVNGSAYYTNTIALSYLTGTGDHKPRISIEPTPGNTLPTEAEQNAYDLLKYATVDNKTLKLYATVKPTSSFYITLSEVSKVS